MPTLPEGYSFEDFLNAGTGGPSKDYTYGLPKYLQRFKLFLAGKVDYAPESPKEYLHWRFTTDQSLVVWTLYQNIIKDEKKYQDAHPQLRIAGGPTSTGFGSVEIGTEEANAMYDIDYSGVDMFQMAIDEASMNASLGRMVAGPEIMGLSLVPYRMVDVSNFLEADRLQRQNISMHTTLSTNRNVANAMQRDQGNIGPSSRRFIRTGRLGLGGVMRTLMGGGRVTPEESKLLDDEFDLDQINDLEWEERKLEEIELEEVNSEIRDNNIRRRRVRIQEEDCPELVLDDDPADDLDDLVLGNDNDDFGEMMDRVNRDVQRERNAMGIESNPRPRVPRGGPMRNFKNVLGMIIGLGGIGGTTAAAIALEKEINKKPDFGVPVKGVEDQTRDDIRRLWPDAEYWPGKLGLSVALWLDPCLAMIDGMALGQLREMVANPGAYYLTWKDANDLEKAALGWIEGGERLPKTTSPIWLETIINYVHGRGLNSKDLQNENAQQVIDAAEQRLEFDTILFQDIWNAYQAVPEKDILKIVLSPDKMEMMVAPKHGTRPAEDELQMLLEFLTLYNAGKLEIQPGRWDQIKEIVDSGDSKAFFKFIGPMTSPYTSTQVPEPTVIQTVLGTEVENSAITINEKTPYKSMQAVGKSNYWLRYAERKGKSRSVKLFTGLANKAMAMWFASPGVEKVLGTEEFRAQDQAEPDKWTENETGEGLSQAKKKLLADILSNVDVSKDGLKALKGREHYSLGLGYSLGLPSAQTAKVKDAVTYHDEELGIKGSFFVDEYEDTYFAFVASWGAISGKMVYTLLDPDSEWISYAVQNLQGGWQYMRAIATADNILWIGNKMAGGAQQLAAVGAKGLNVAAAAGVSVITATSKLHPAAQGILVTAVLTVTALGTVRYVFYDNDEDFVNDATDTAKKIKDALVEVGGSVGAGLGVGFGVIGIGYILSQTGLPSTGFGVPPMRKKKRKRN